MASVPDVAEEKRRLRRELGALRKEVPPEVREAAGLAAAAHVLALPQLRGARRIALHAALPDELPTRPLFDALAGRGLAVWFPRMDGDRLRFAAVARWDLLRPDAFGVETPPGPGSLLGPDDVAVVPGVAFDRAGNRLGRGGGHYDRAFPGDAPYLVGLAYHFQLRPRVPCDSRDRPMDAIVTERGVIVPERSP